MPSFTDWLRIFAPTFLQDEGGQAILGAMGAQLDRGVDLTKLAVKARFPELAPPDGLAKLAAERQIQQAPWETLAAWATYVRGAYEVWGGDPVLGGGAGTPIGILVAVSRSGIPFRYSSDPTGAVDATTYIQWNGRWVQLYADGRTPIFGFLDNIAARPTTQPGWYDANPTFSSKSWLLFPTPGGVIPGLDNTAGNALKVKLNATVDLWKASAETYGGAWVFESTTQDIGDYPPGSDEWELVQGVASAGVLGWPPQSLDPFRVIGGGFDVAQSSSMKIDPA